MFHKKAVSALVATVLLILITVAAVGIIWGAIMPMLNRAMELNQACMNARLTIDTTSGYTCYDSSKKQASIMISRGAEDFQLAGMQIGLASGEIVKSYEVREGANLLTNGDFELWSAGVNAAPDGWGLSGANAVVNRQSPTYVKFGTYSAGLTRVGNDCSLSLDTYLSDEKGIAYWKGKTITLGCWVSCDTAIRARIGISDGLTNTFSSYHTGDDTYQFLTVTKILSINAIVVDIYLKVDTGDASAYFDGCMAVEGPNPVIWEENTIYGELPNQNEARTYKLAGEDIAEARVAPIVKVGTTEKICDVTSKVPLPRCA